MGEGTKLNIKEYKVFKTISSAKGNLKSEKKGPESSYNSFKE